MEKTEHLPKLAAVTTAVAILALALGCSSRDPILGVGGIAIMAPSVTAVAPANGANPVAYTTTTLTAAFSEAMVPFSGAATFTVSTPAPGLSPTGTVTLDATATVATLTLSTPLAPLTTYTARIAGATSFATGLPMAAPYLWSFTTGALDVTRPRVTLTVPATTVPGPTLVAPANAAITATFTEDMAPASITAASFTVSAPLPALPLAGAVAYSASSRTALFTPVTALTVGTVYTARLTTVAKDLAGNALAGNQAPLPAASDYVWTFTASAPSPQGALTVASTSPANNATNVSPAAAVNATLALPSGLRLDPATVTTATFTLTGPGLTPVPAASVTLDATTGRIATFTPLGALTTGATYTATLLAGATGVKDLAIPANQLAAAYTWTFTVGALPAGAVPVVLGSIASFGTFGGSAGTTNQGIKTIVNGDIGTTAISTLVTGFHDAGVGNVYTETPLNIGLVNGKIYTSPPAPTAASLDEGTAATAAIALQARADALTAYNTLVAKPGGADPGAGNLANLTLAPGTYTALAGSFMIRGGDLTLDAKGDANAVFIFQMANSLTVGGPGAAFPQSLILVNGAQPQNIFWQVGSAATINAGGGGTMAGTIISQAGAALSTSGNTTLLTLNGRVISLGASVTLVNTVINVPSH